jgi:hypothetical protein
LRHKQAVDKVLEADFAQSQKTGNIEGFLLFHQQNIELGQLAALFMCDVSETMVVEEIPEAVGGLIDPIYGLGLPVLSLQGASGLTLLAAFVRRDVGFVLVCHGLLVGNPSMIIGPYVTNSKFAIECTK